MLDGRPVQWRIWNVESFANFMAENPDIEVDYIPVAWSGEPAYAEKISTWAASGTLPDVLKVPYT